MRGRIRVIGALIVAVALVILSLPSSEADAAGTASDFKMEGTTLVKYRGTANTVSVPDTVETIGESAFEGNTNVELIVLPASVTKIESYAFWGCEKLETVVLGKGLSEVGDFAFARCSGLKQISIPSNVSRIGLMAFADCMRLEDVSIPPETSDIHETAFDGCIRLAIHYEQGTAAEKFAEKFYERQKNMPEYEDIGSIPGDSETSDSAGKEDVEEQDTKPDSDDESNDKQQQEETVTGNEMGNSKVVGNRAVVFLDNSRGTVYQGQDNHSNNPETSEAVTTQNVVETGMDSSDSDNRTDRFSIQNPLNKFTVVDGKIIADQAYYQAPLNYGFEVPEGITEIGQFSFARSSVKNVSLPDGVETVSYGAFYHCDELVDIALPDSIRNVEPNAFVHTGLVDAFLNGQNVIGGKAYVEDDDFLISGSTLIAYRGHDKEVHIPDSVRVIAAQSLCGHTEIENVVIPDSVLVIGEGAFEDCENLTTVVIGDCVEAIKDRAFYHTKLVSVSLPTSLDEIGLLAFPSNTERVYNGSNRPTATCENSARRLSNDAYRDCGAETDEPGVTVVELPDAYASLEGASRAYVLRINTPRESENIERAWERLYGQNTPDNMNFYELIFFDNSGIPLNKLGNQYLTVYVPIPENLQNQRIEAVTLDRNGQLEAIFCDRVSLAGTQYIRFRVNQISEIGLYGTGELSNSSQIQCEEVSLESLSGIAKGNTGERVAEFEISTVVRRSIGIILLAVGSVMLVLHRPVKRRK